ncbi:hypothetical protein AGABI1DRAFT_25516, partial [Agaricus bisporus var. burnettii JB137-S8]
LPATIQDLRSKLLEGSQLPDKPDSSPVHHILSQSEKLSLRHFIAWKQSRGTVLAYNLHRQVLEAATGTKILSLHLAKSLAKNLAHLESHRFDMCPNSHIAYTGAHEMLKACPGFKMKDKKQIPCNLPRYK